MATDSFKARSVPLQGSVRVPGSKSISNRALICAALAPGSSELFGLAEGDDTLRMIAGIRQLGVTVVGEVDGLDSEPLRVTGPIVRTDRPDIAIDAGLAGTTSRFLTALAALSAGRTTITGGAGLLARPMDELHRALRTLGVTVSAEREGFLPVTVQGGSLPSTVERAALRASNTAPQLVIGGDVSSQFISALMMIAPAIGGLILRFDGPVVSRGYLEMTARVMQRFGAEVSVHPDHVSVAGRPYQPARLDVDADWSSASYPFAAVAIAGGEVSIPRLQRNGTQPEEAFVDVLEQLGCKVSVAKHGVAVSREPGVAPRGINVDMSAMSDLVPTLATIAVCADGASRITGVGFIRGKESDRLGDLATELNECGGRVRVLDDGLSIEPSTLRAATVNTHDDHRLAMSLALLGLRCDGIVVSDPAVVGKSWPSYWRAMRAGLSLG